MNENSVTIPTHQPGDMILFWTPPKRPRRWWRFWDRGKTFVILDGKVRKL